MAKSNKKQIPVIYSMTGFGTGAAENSIVRIEIEIRSLNSRNLDLVFRFPREYFPFESALRKKLSGSLQRGRVEVYGLRKPVENEIQSVQIQKELVQGYMSQWKDLCADLSISWEDEKARFLERSISLPGVMKEEGSGEIDPSEQELLFEAFEKAVENVKKMRQEEGKSLATDIHQYRFELSQIRENIQKKVEENTPALQEKFQKRIQQLCADQALDELRLAQESAILADRLDVSEELSRLEAHLERFEEVLSEELPGRTLQFLLQEIGREFNTISSKIQNAEIQSLVVNGKGVLEKLREQIQNIE